MDPMMIPTPFISVILRSKTTFAGSSQSLMMMNEFFYFKTIWYVCTVILIQLQTNAITSILLIVYASFDKNALPYVDFFHSNITPKKIEWKLMIQFISIEV